MDESKRHAVQFLEKEIKTYKALPTCHTDEKEAFNAGRGSRTRTMDGQSVVVDVLRPEVT